MAVATSYCPPRRPTHGGQYQNGTSAQSSNGGCSAVTAAARLASGFCGWVSPPDQVANMICQPKQAPARQRTDDEFRASTVSAPGRTRRLKTSKARGAECHPVPWPGGLVKRIGTHSRLCRDIRGGGIYARRSSKHRISNPPLCRQAVHSLCLNECNFGACGSTIPLY